MSPDLDELVMKQNNAAPREDPDCVDHHRCLPKHLNLIPESEPIICLDLTDTGSNDKYVAILAPI